MQVARRSGWLRIALVTCSVADANAARCSRSTIAGMPRCAAPICHSTHPYSQVTAGNTTLHHSSACGASGSPTSARVAGGRGRLCVAAPVLPPNCGRVTLRGGAGRGCCDDAASCSTHTPCRFQEYMNLLRRGEGPRPVEGAAVGSCDVRAARADSDAPKEWAASGGPPMSEVVWVSVQVSMDGEVNERDRTGRGCTD